MTEQFTILWLGDAADSGLIQHDSHVIMWRSWLWVIRGIHVDKHGRRFDRRGNPA